MKRIKILLTVPLAAAIIAILASGCTLFGLKKQTDFDRPTNVDTIDAHLNMTAWAYIKSRGLQSHTKTDTPLALLQRAIIYSGIDTNEYIKPGRTYICPNSASVKLVFAGFFTSANKAATKWQDYSKADVKNYLLYLILDQQYTHYNMPYSDVTAQTLAPAGTYTTQPVGFKVGFPNYLTFYPNPTSNMLIKVLNASNGNTSDYPIFINENNYVTTSDLLATNGVVDVVATLISPSRLP
ncbi:MAG: hypothetical protein V4592_24880 [Bacteroidota bacterium]